MVVATKKTTTFCFCYYIFVCQTHFNPISCQSPVHLFFGTTKNFKKVVIFCIILVEKKHKEKIHFLSTPNYIWKKEK